MPILLVPVILIVIIPTIFVLTIYFVPEEMGDLETLLSMLPESAGNAGIQHTILRVILNNLLPVFFLIIPIMTSSVMAASSFVGEKEKYTLETLLYCPLSLGQIFYAKIMASFLMSMLVSLLSFAAMILVMETEIAVMFGSIILPLVELACPAASALPFGLADRHHSHCEWLRESTVHGRVAAEGRVPDSAPDAAHHRAVCRNPAGERVASSDPERDMRICRLDTDKRLPEPLYLRVSPAVTYIPVV